MHQIQPNYYLRTIMPYVLVVLVLGSGSQILFGQGSANLQDQYHLRITEASESIVVDGIVSEASWQNAEVATDFWMSFPRDGERVVPEHQTEVRVTYDERYIYVAAICHGDGPFFVPTLKRDAREFWRGDAFSVVFDPINEKSNGVSFGVNPSGVQTEALVSGDTGRRGSRGGGINSAWDNKWISEAQVYDDRWTLEIAIPFKSLRFGSNEVWGVNFIRGHSQSNSYHTWSPVPVQFRGLDLGFTGAIVWDKAPQSSSRNISVIPYILGSTFKDHEAGTKVDNEFRAGGDAK